MSFPHFSFPGRKSRRDRQAQRSAMDDMVASDPTMQGERARGRQRTRHGGSPVPSSGPRHEDYGFSGHDLSGFGGTSRTQDSQFSYARDPLSPSRRPRGGRDGLALDGLGYRTYSPMPSGLRRRFRSPEHYTTQARSHRSLSSGSPDRQRYQSPPPRRYAPRSTTSGYLSFDSERQSSSYPSSTSISSLNLGPPALPVRSSGSTGNHDNDLHGSRESSQFTSRNSSASRNALTRVQRSEYRPERESPREALRRSYRDSRVPEYARGPRSAIPVEDVRQRGIGRYHNEAGFPSWYERQLRHARPSEAERDHEGRPRRVEQQGFRGWYRGN